MKAVQTRCPQKALAVWCWLRLRLKAVRSIATCKRPAPRSLSREIIVSQLAIHRETGCVHRISCVTIGIQLSGLQLLGGYRFV